MSINIAWQCLSVGKFIDDCNWFGWSPEIIAEVDELSLSVYELKQSLLAWQTLSTQDFFALNNWNGLSTVPNTVGKEITIDENQIFSFTLANDRFWSCFAWLGPIDLPVTNAEKFEPIPEAASEFTLSDLSQLF